MRNNRQQSARAIYGRLGTLLLLPALALIGCSSSPSSTATATKSKVIVTISPLYNPTMGTGEQVQITAGSYDPNDSSPGGVIFTVTCTGATGAGCGSLANETFSNATYVAPATVSGNVSVTVTATSISDATVSASITFPVVTTVFTISPVGPLTLNANQSVTVTTTLDPDPGLTNTNYSVTGAGCVNNGATGSCGNVSTITGTNGKNFIYTAPGSAIPLAVHFTLTPAADPSISQTLVINVPPNVDNFSFSPAILPPAIAGATNYSQTITISGGTPPYTVDMLTSTVPSWVTSLTTLGNPGNILTVMANGQSYYQFTTTGQFTVSGSVPVSSTIVNNGGQPLPVSANDILFSTTDSASNSSTNGVGLDIYSALGSDNALLTGNYVFSGLGFQDGTTIANAERIGYIGQFTADGNGNITGYMDINQTAGSYSEKIRGNYEVSSNQTGFMTIENDGDAPTPISFAITLGGVSTTNGSASRGAFVEYDDITGNGNVPKSGSSQPLCCGGTRAQGRILQQSASVLNATANPLVGSYAFAMSGRNPYALAGMASPTAGACMIVSSTSVPSCGPAAVAGSLALTATGTITGGEQDITQGETTNNLVGIGGTGLAKSGATDQYGRAAANITATTGNTGLNDWPSNYVVYAVNPSTFFAMSTDPYASNTLLEGEGLQQNIPQVQMTPFSGTSNVIVYGSTVSNQNFYVVTTSATTGVATQGTALDGASTASQQQLMPVPSGGTAGSMSGTQYVQYGGQSSGFSSPQSPGTASYDIIPTLNYTVDSYGRVANTSQQIGLGPVSGGNPAPNTDNVPILYLTGTDNGIGVGTGISGAGIFVAQQQTITAGATLSGGTYSWFNSFPISQTAPLQAGSLTIPAGGIPNGTSNTNVNISGQAYQSYFSSTYNESDGGYLLFATALSGTLGIKNSQLSTFSVTTGVQGCSGYGFIVTPTEFLCFPSTTGYTSVQVFQQ